MKQIKAHIAVSLDGHTATLDKELDWLPNEVKAIIGKYYLDADYLLMGANTYNYIFEHWGGWPVSVSAMLPLFFKQEYLALSSKKDESRNSFSPYSRSLQGTFA